MKLFRVMRFIMSLTLSTVVSHIALLTQALVLCTWSPIHTPNVTVLDCGKNKTKIHTHEHRPALGFSSVYPNTCCRLYLRHQQNWHWTMFLKRYASRYFLKKIMVWHREDVDGGHLPKHTHSQSTLTHTRSQNPQDRPLVSRMWLQHISVASVLGS